MPLYDTYDISKVNSFKKCRVVLKRLFADRNDLLSRVKALEEEKDQLIAENRSLVESLNQCQEAKEQFETSFDERVADIRNFAQSALNRVEGSPSETDSSQNGLIMDLTNSLEVIENTKNSNKFILRCFPTNGQQFFPEKTPRDRVLEALKVLDASQATSKMAMIRNIKPIKPHIFKITVKKEDSSNFLNFLKTKKGNETSSIKFQSYLNLVTRCKKKILGHIMSHENARNPRKICIPRFSLEAKAIVETQNGRVHKKYHKMIEEYGRTLTLPEKNSTLKMLEKYMTPSEAKIKLGLVGL